MSSPSSSSNKFTKIHGIHSFVTSVFPNDLFQEIVRLNRECINRLHYGPAGKSHKMGISFAIEAPKCCPNYAMPNFSRNVPLRQYFGKDNIEESDLKSDCVKRWSYGVGSGSSTVGGDTKSTKTRPLTKVMEDMCTQLNTYIPTICYGEHCEESYDFNHVTILYYLIDSNGNNKVTLRKHTDLEVSPSNLVKNGNSQKAGTPTVVIALQQPKQVRFYKRYSNGIRFDETDHIGGFDMEHGDMFILHPADERVIKRNVECLLTEGSNNSNREELKPSQFQHSVTCSTSSSSKGNKRERTIYRTHISVCFRQTTTCLKYSSTSDLLVDEFGGVAENDNRTPQMVKRSLLIDQNRSLLKSEEYQQMTRTLMANHAKDSSILQHMNRKGMLKKTNKQKKLKKKNNHS